MKRKGSCMGTIFWAFFEMKEDKRERKLLLLLLQLYCMMLNWSAGFWGGAILIRYGGRYARGGCVGIHHVFFGVEGDFLKGFVVVARNYFVDDVF